MKLLLDTHILLWVMRDADELSPAARAMTVAKLRGTLLESFIVIVKQSKTFIFKLKTIQWITKRQA